MGNNNRLEAYVSAGTPAEKHGYFYPLEDKEVVLGDNNIIREFVTLNSGSRRPTKMGNNCLMLRGSHLSHDSVLEDKVTVSCTSMIGGESYIMTGVNLGLGSLVHQFSVIGSYSMIGMGAVCAKTLQAEPGNIYVGNPARFYKANLIGLQRNGVSSEKLREEHLRWEQIKKDNSGK